MYSRHRAWAGLVHGLALCTDLHVHVHMIHLAVGIYPSIRIWVHHNNTVKQHFYVHDKFMRICPNVPLDKFMQFLFVRSSVCNVWPDRNSCGTNLCNLCLTCIIPINKSHAWKKSLYCIIEISTEGGYRIRFFLYSSIITYFLEHACIAAILWLQKFALSVWLVH